MCITNSGDSLTKMIKSKSKINSCDWFSGKWKWNGCEIGSFALLNRLFYCSCKIWKQIGRLNCMLSDVCAIASSTVIVESETDWSPSGYDCLVSDRNYSIFILCSCFSPKHSISVAVAKVCNVFCPLNKY